MNYDVYKNMAMSMNFNFLSAIPFFCLGNSPPSRQRTRCVFATVILSGSTTFRDDGYISVGCAYALNNIPRRSQPVRVSCSVHCWEETLSVQDHVSTLLTANANHTRASQSLVVALRFPHIPGSRPARFKDQMIHRAFAP